MRLAQLQSNAKSLINWVAFAVASFLIGDLKQSLEVFDSFWKIAENDKEISRSERSMVRLFEADLIYRSGEHKQLKQYLLKWEKEIVDKVAYLDLMLKSEISSGDMEQQRSILEYS